MLPRVRFVLFVDALVVVAITQNLKAGDCVLVVCVVWLVGDCCSSGCCHFKCERGVVVVAVILKLKGAECKGGVRLRCCFTFAMGGRDGKEIPVMFAATKNASMDESVLMQAFKMMDDLGITERGIDEDGNPYFPYIILDGHTSRIGELFLRYVNDPSTRWGTGLGAPLATEYYQFHDDLRQNGALKTSLTNEKSEFFLKKRIHGLPAEMLPVKIVIVARGAILKSFMNSAYAEATLAHRGFRPFNRNPLDVPSILRTAPEETQRERAIVLRSRGIDNPLAAPLPPLSVTSLQPVLAFVLEEPRRPINYTRPPQH